MESRIGDLVRHLITGLVAKEESVQVEEIEKDDGAVSFQVRVDPDDYGRIIGRGGIVANSVRTVVKAAAAKTGQKVYVDILK